LELTYLLQNMSNYSLAPSPAAVPENSSEKVPGNIGGGVDSTNISEEEQNKFLEKLSAFAKSKKGERNLVVVCAESEQTSSYHDVHSLPLTIIIQGWRCQLHAATCSAAR
jgi:hypothetical protein